MKRIVTSSQMKYLDEKTIVYHKIDSMTLMERAALSVVKHVEQHHARQILVVCGSGNNGGDGIAIARILHLKGACVSVYFAGNRQHMSDGCRQQIEIAESYGIEFVQNPDYKEYDTIIDAIFGVGLSREITGTYADIIEKINQTDAYVIAVDIPSGVNADDGKILGIAVKADVTVTFAYEKAGELLWPGKEYCGTLITEDIGIYDRDESFDENYFSFEKQDLNLIPKRKEFGNKGTFGKVLLIAGSHDMPGASVLCGQAVMRIGSGMLKMVIPKANREIIAAGIPEAMLAVYDSGESAVEQIKQGFAWADIVVVGPGIGQNEVAYQMMEYIMHHCKLPLVIDADGLNILSIKKDWLSSCSCPCILTPHVGEMARLLDTSVSEIKSNTLYLVREFVSKYHIQCVLKDVVTCTALPDQKIYINQSGNCGMATAGAGDVLTGMIAGLLSVGVKWEIAGALGVWLHGACGDYLKAQVGTAYIMASDLIKAISAFHIGENGGYQ